MTEKQSCKFHTVVNTTESITPRKDEEFYTSLGKLEDCSETMERVSIDGDKAVGIILYIRQLHKPMLHPRDPIYINEILPIVTQYQRSIFELLKNQKSEIIFIEGIATNQIPGFISDLHKKREQGKISDNEILRNFGGPILYELVYGKKDKVTFLRSGDINVPSVCGIGTLRKDPMSWKDCNTLREGFLANEIKTYLKENPGKKVQVVYGAGHVIDDDIRTAFGGENLPFVQEIVFGKAIQDYAKNVIKWGPEYKKNSEQRMKNGEPLQMIDSDHYREYLPVLEKQWEERFGFPPYIDDSFIQTIDRLLELNITLQGKSDWQIPEDIAMEYRNKRETLLHRIKTKSSLYVFREFESSKNVSSEEIMQKRTDQESRVEKEFPKFIEWIMKSIPLLGKIPD